MAWTARDISDLSGRTAVVSGANGSLGLETAPRFINFGAAVRRPIFRRIGLDRAIDRLWEVSERDTKLTLDLRL